MVHKETQASIIYTYHINPYQSMVLLQWNWIQYIEEHVSCTTS